MKNKSACLVAAVLLAVDVSAQTPVWTQMAGSPSGTTRHDDMVFVGETNGWSARGRGGIFKTTDAGKTWVQKLNQPGTHFRCIGFVSKTRGFAGNLGAGSYDANVTDTNVLYETFDGGETWSVVPGISEKGMKGFCAMYVLDSQHIYGGGRVRGPAHFVKSEDGGTKWTVVDLKSAGVMGGIMDVYFKDPLNGFVVGMDTNEFFTNCGGNYHGRIARTTDGGATWTAVADTGLACSYFWKMSWPTPQVGYASLQQNATATANSLIFYKTMDGGATWISNGIPYASIGIPSFSLLQGIGFISENEGWVGGPSGVSGNNFLHTTNGGASWTPVGYNDSQQINRIRFYPKFAIASGSKLHIYKVPLAITTPPQSQTNAAGSTVLLEVGAQGAEPLTFQWRFNGTNLSGANASAYSISNFQSSNAGDYDVVIGDFSGSVTSAVATLALLGSSPPIITSPPQSQTVWLNSNVTISVTASGTPPLRYQWRFNGADLAGATNSSFVLAGARLQDAGDYSVLVANAAGTLLSAPATLTVISTNGVLFYDDFDRFTSPSVVTGIGDTNGYRIVFSAASGPVDMKAIFGFDYSTVTFPTSIPRAPHSVGTSKGLFLTVNKDGTGSPAAVNLYPTNRIFGGDFSLKFDMWINWADVNTSTEHTLIGINHSGAMTNRIGKSGSDGLFFAVEGEDDTSPISTTLRDYAVFHGGGNGIPVLMTNNTVFGPAPLLSPQFENYDPGFVALFPAQTFPGFGTTPAGTAGLRWVSGEIRQRGNLITWLLNGTLVAQYTNTFGYTNGNILLGYQDYFSSIGDSNNFVVLDNIRVDPFMPGEVRLVSPQLVGGDFSFKFLTEWGENYVVQRATNLVHPNWTIHTNVAGNQTACSVHVPVSEQATETYFRVVRQ